MFRVRAVTNIFFIAFAAFSASIVEARDCVQSDKKFGSREFEVSVTKHHDKTAATKTILIMPPTGGTGYLDRSYARRFCSVGYDVYVLNTWTADTGASIDLEIHQGFYSRMLKAVELVIIDVKSPFIGILGTSLGGLYAAVAASQVQKLDAVFMIVAGAPVMEVVVRSDQQVMKRLAKERRARFGFTSDADYLAALNAKFKLEPMSRGGLQASKDIGMVVANHDTTVPTAQQRRLQEAWKPRKVITLDNSHIWAIVKTWLFHEDEIVSFFDESSGRRLTSPQSSK